MSTNCEVFWTDYPTARDDGTALLATEIEGVEIWYRVGGAPTYTLLGLVPFNPAVKAFALDGLEDGVHEVDGVLLLKDGTSSTVSASITLPVPIDPVPSNSPPRQLVGFGIRPV